MGLAIFYPQGDANSWVHYFKEADPSLEIQVWPDIDYRRPCEMAVAWYQPHGEVAKLQGVRCVASLGAGVEHILEDPSIPESLIVTRVEHPYLTREMKEYVVMMVLIHTRQFLLQQSQQQNKVWIRDTDKQNSWVGHVGIMGLGVLGGAVAQALLTIGIPVCSWSRTAKELEGCCCFWGKNQLDEFLSMSNVLVCLLPLTRETENVLNASLFNKLPKDAYLINVGRGKHLVEEDLLNALANGQLSGACLDVFRVEPLPTEHPFWSHSKIIVTPHISSISSPRDIAFQISENYQRLKRGEPLLYTVDRALGY